MKKLFCILVIVFIPWMPLTPTHAQTGLSELCSTFAISPYDGWTSSVDPGVPNPGETFTIHFVATGNLSATVQLVGATSGTPLFDAGTLTPGTPVTLTYTIPASGSPAGSIGVGARITGVSGEGDINITPSCVPGGVAASGCTTLMGITSTSVVGLFVADTQTYWRPGDLTNPLVTIPAGKTAWVLGLNSTEEYYKIIWVCNYLWVPVSDMAPNPDHVWNSKPLPTDIIQ
jgi:hypothetical protein